MGDQLPRRRILRLRDYDYTQSGAYFVTIVAQDRACLFGEVVHQRVYLNEAGKMIEKHWLALPQRFSHIETDSFIVMPNHFHSILVVAPDQRAGTSPAPTAKHMGAVALGHVVGAFKSITTWDYARGVHEQGWPRFRQRLWQRNYYEHVIRDEGDLLRARQYIDANPANWSLDEENPNVAGR